MISQHRVNVTCASSHLTMEEAEANFGAVNHASVVLHVDAALLPATGWIVRRIPFYVLNRLQVLMRHFLQRSDDVGLWWRTETITQSGLLSLSLRDDCKRKSARRSFPMWGHVWNAGTVGSITPPHILSVGTFLGVTVHRMLMILLDFSCPSWGFFLRNSRLLHERQDNFTLQQTHFMLSSKHSSSLAD